MERAVPELIQVLADRTAFNRICAAEALGKIGSPRSLQPLQKLLNEEAEHVVIIDRELKWIKAKDVIIEAIERIAKRRAQQVAVS